jgi:hypothetical protein
MSNIVLLLNVAVVNMSPSLVAFFVLFCFVACSYSCRNANSGAGDRRPRRLPVGHGTKPVPCCLRHPTDADASSRRDSRGG